MFNPINRKIYNYINKKTINQNKNYLSLYHLYVGHFSQSKENIDIENNSPYKKMTSKINGIHFKTLKFTWTYCFFEKSDTFNLLHKKYE